MHDDKQQTGLKPSVQGPTGKRKERSAPALAAMRTLLAADGERGDRLLPRFLFVAKASPLIQLHLVQISYTKLHASAVFHTACEREFCAVATRICQPRGGHRF